MTSWGAVLLVTDNMQLSLYADPATLTGSRATTWAPTAGPWSSWTPVPLPPGEQEGDYVYAGGIIDASDVLYLVDKRNRAVRAVQLSATGPGFVELPYSPYYFDPSVTFTVPETASLLLVPQASAATDQLWLPVAGSLLGVKGIAIVIATSYFRDQQYPPFFAPLPDGDCIWPEDFGSVALPAGVVTEGTPGVLMLSSTECGAVAFTADVTTGTTQKQYWTGTGYYSFAGEGEHAHPVYDAASDSLLWVDYSTRVGAPQQLCCVKLSTGFGSCDNWEGACARARV